MVNWAISYIRWRILDHGCGPRKYHVINPETPSCWKLMGSDRIFALCYNICAVMKLS